MFAFAPNAFAAEVYSQDLTSTSVTSSNDFYYISATYSGTVEYIQIYAKSTDQSHVTSFSLAGESCSTAAKSLADWGFPNVGGADQSGMAIVTIGPFAGADCAVTKSGYTGVAFNFDAGDGNSFETAWYLRVFDTDPIGPPAPTTDFNEVIYYIPSVGVSTTTGTTDVGAMFSIPQPEFIEYIGYRIFSPSNQIVYDATTTPTVAGLYEISTSYNFTDVGVYTGHAYFAQDYGGNVWEVDNTTIQQILIDVPEWTVDPDTGGFSQNPATTSTTTLSNLTLDCGAGFTGSVCNLIAHLVIPSANSIGAVQSTFALVLSKAPFSFFTESHQVLQALTGSSGAQQSLSLNLYGANIEVVSTTTADSIGLDTTQINFLKFIMSVGLWILLGWYLYWRVASIFGV